MEEVKVVYLNKVAKALSAMGAKFHIVLEDFEVGEPVQSAGRREVVNCGVTEYVRSYLKDFPVGEVKIIPSNGYEPKALQAVTCYVNRSLYKNGVFTTARVGDAVQVLRLE